MGRARASVALAALLLLCGAAAQEVPLAAARWLSPEADRVRALTTAPTECLRIPPKGDDAWRVEVGRAAFRTPVVLGGQAARAGVACETCHSAGRRNPDFLFPGVSGAPGTADVTSSLFSTHRGDGIDNPKPIPDLSAPKAALKISQDPKGRALERFLHGLVVDDFDGPEPPAAVLDGLAAYVRALSPEACPKAPRRALGPALDLGDALRAVAAARRALARNDPETAAVMLMAARHALGLAHERFVGAPLARDRRALAAADLELVAALESVRRGESGAELRLLLWDARIASLAPALAADARLSLYEPANLQAAAGTALSARRTGPARITSRASPSGSR